MNRAIIIIIVFLLIVSFTGNQLPQAQTAQKFKVAVLVDCENDNVKSLMESYIKGELRSLGDVQIVGNNFENALWQYMILLHATEPSYESGRKVGLLVVSYDFFEIVPYWHFNELRKDYYKQFPAIYIPMSGTASYPIDNLDQLCKGIIANFDTINLQRVRDFRN